MVVRHVEWALGVTVSAGVVAAAACSGNGNVTYAPDAGVDLQPTGGAGVGRPCDATHYCRGGLTCAASVCAPGHSSGEGAACIISAECKQGDYCGPSRRCAPAGKGADGSSCKSDADCAGGLRCDFAGVSAVCSPEGGVDVGGACVTSNDCFGGLACSSKTCAPLPVSPGGIAPLGLPSWKGADCVDDPGPTKAYFRVPRGKDDGDFYRLPFPNDARIKSGHPDLSGHPTAGDELLGYDLVDRYLRDVEQNEDGFSAYPTVTLRFSGEVDFGTVQAGLHWVELSATGAGTGIGFAWTATTGRDQYLCPNSISARPLQGAPLKPGATYAFIVTNQVHDVTGKPIAVDADFKAMIDTTAPADPTLLAAWPKYKVLRDWATANGGTTTVLDAAVFTVGHPAAIASKLMAAVASAPPPTAGAWVKCGGAAASPCPQASGDRACGAQDPAFDELHTLVTLPIFQRGAAPYATPADGGDIALDASGVPHVEHTEPVCMSLTVPKGAMPAAGWPLVIYAHGTGGSFRSQVTDGVAAILAAAKDDAGTAVPMAVLGIDQVLHGTRRGGSSASPSNLVYNFANPLAARGNPLQAAADQAALVRFVQGLAIPASVTGSAVTIDHVAFWGHSQGATAGAIAMPYVAGVGSVVLSGEGASLIDTLLTKRSPVNIADVLPQALAETSMDAYHPVLTILQTALDSADPLNHARALAAAPAAGMPAKHVFQPYGLGDSFSPPPTEATFALAAGLGVALAAPSVLSADPIGGSLPTPLPASGNLMDGTRPITAFVREYQPSPPLSYDGHFVAFKDPDARLDIATFLAGALTGKTPKVGHP